MKTVGQVADILVAAGKAPDCDFEVMAVLVEAGVRPGQACRSIFPMARSYAKSRRDRVEHEARAA